MQFDNPNVHANYIDKNDLRNYLITKLRENLGFEYEVFVSSVIWKNELGINIDETTMTDESYKTLVAFKKQYHLNSDLDVLSQFMNAQFGGSIEGDFRFEFNYLVPDLEGVYIIRYRLEDTVVRHEC